MPELPEVETIRRGLERELVGRCIVELTVRETRMRVPLNVERLRAAVLAREVLAVSRRAKYLLIHLGPLEHLGLGGPGRAGRDAASGRRGARSATRERSASRSGSRSQSGSRSRSGSGSHVLATPASTSIGATSVLIHLGMSGRLSLHAPDEPRASHTHVEWTLDDGRTLRFRDPRRFGLIDSIAASEFLEHPRLRALGVEPLSREFRAEELHARTRGLRRSVKTFLMDAEEVVGIGNIYASEALHGAGVHPERAVGRIARARWERIVVSVRGVLEAALERGGTTLNDYRDAAGKRGGFGERLAVYGREGDPCDRCGEAIRRRVHGGRSTYYCARCQR